ncbi:MAG TPA: prolipoprotein diacylglyceryl transferase family protein [Candidatus Babeliales bacterium]|nr:prolipoprotein diacylglyceryl transferase family protein [Candidatus Babeliales bacterium]
MYPTLIHIYGPISIHSYGAMIALGLIIFSLLALNDPRREKILTTDLFIMLLIRGIIAAIVGGKILFALTNWHLFEHPFEFIEFWHGGFSILGSILSVIAVIPWYLKKYSIDKWQLLDLAALYAPLLQSIARIGCFFAGCCFGLPTRLFVGISIADEYGNVCMRHPSQLYSSALLFFIFLFLYAILQKRVRTPGVLALWYVALVTAERFFVDFFREDHIIVPMPFLPFFSINQWIALIMCLTSVGLLLAGMKRKHYEPFQFH